MQTTALFTLPSAWSEARRMESADWRSLWVDQKVGSLEDWNQVRVVSVRDMLWIISGSPAANEWLASHLDAIAAAVAAHVDDAVPLQVRSRAVSVRGGEDEVLWAYRFPRIVVAKGSGDWQPHFAVTLDPEIGAGIVRRIEAGLRRELDVWGRLPASMADAPFLVLADPGRAVIIPAIHANRSGHGKPVNILARAGLVVLSSVRIEGDLFAGSLPSLGYGRMLRTRAPETLSRDTQRALSALPDLIEESL